MDVNGFILKYTFSAVVNQSLTDLDLKALLFLVNHFTFFFFLLYSGANSMYSASASQSSSKIAF